MWSTENLRSVITDLVVTSDPILTIDKIQNIGKVLQEYEVCVSQCAVQKRQTKDPCGVWGKE